MIDDLIPTDCRLMGAIHRARKLRNLRNKLIRAREHLATYHQLIDELSAHEAHSVEDHFYFRGRVDLWRGYIAQFTAEIAALLAVAKSLNRP